MPEAVIVATARSPIGRAMKGSLKDIRPDDLSAQVLTDLMSKVPAVTPDHIDDLLMGCGQPAGESGDNIGRATAVGCSAGTRFPASRSTATARRR
jgi:acetyl-CoA C-acetyltransferase